jgi:hypothetical protein
LLSAPHSAPPPSRWRPAAHTPSDRIPFNEVSVAVNHCQRSRSQEQLVGVHRGLTRGLRLRMECPVLISTFQ